MHSKTIWKFTKCNENVIYCTRSRTKIPLNTINLNLIRECHLKNYLSGVSVFAFCAPYLSFFRSHSLGEWGIHVIWWFFFICQTQRTHIHKQLILLSDLGRREEKKIGNFVDVFLFGIDKFYWPLKRRQLRARKGAWVSYLQYINSTSLAANFANATSLCIFRKRNIEFEFMDASAYSCAVGWN